MSNRIAVKNTTGTAPSSNLTQIPISELSTSTVKLRTGYLSLESYVFLTGTTGPGSPVLYDAILPSATVGISYSQSLTVLRGLAPYTFALGVGSSLPAGLTLSTSGVLSGTPTATGTTTFTVNVTDATGGVGSQSLTITINAASTGGTSVTNYGFFT